MAGIVSRVRRHWKMRSPSSKWKALATSDIKSQRCQTTSLAGSFDGHQDVSPKLGTPVVFMGSWSPIVTKVGAKYAATATSIYELTPVNDQTTMSVRSLLTPKD